MLLSNCHTWKRRKSLIVHQPSQFALQARCLSTPRHHIEFSDNLRRQPSRNHPSGFTVPLPCFFPLCLAGRLEIPSGATKGDQAMGRCQTEIYYPTEASYLKSVLLWLQEYWTGPAVQVRPLKPVPQVSRYYSPRRTYAAQIDEAK